MEDDSNLAENLEIFKRFCPAFADAVKEASQEDYAFCKSENGSLNLKKETDGKSVYFHSTQDPCQEAERWFESLGLDGKETALVVFGIGLGFYYKPCKRWLQEDPERVLVFIECDFSLLKMFFKTPFAKEILDDPQTLVMGVKEGIFDSKWDSRSIEFISLLLFDSTIQFSEIKSYKAPYRDFWVNIKKMIQLQIREKRLLATLIKPLVLKTETKNTLFNYWSLSGARLFYDLEGSLEGVPAVICGAGPSIIEDIQILKEIKDSALVIGAGSGLNILSKHHIFPYLGVGIDPHDTTRSRMLTNRSYMTPFCCLLRYNSDALEILHGTKILFRGNDFYGVGKWLEEKTELIDYPSINIPVSTTQACVRLAQLLGCSPIILVGVDLAYTDRKRYPKEISVHPVDAEDERHLLTRFRENEILFAQGTDGTDVLSRGDWVVEGSRYTEFAKEHPETEFINATKKGLKILDIPSFSMEEVAAKKLQLTFDIDNLTHAHIQNCRKIQATAGELKEHLKEWEESLDRCLFLVEEILKELGSIIKEYALEKDTFPEDFESEPYKNLVKKFKEEAAFKNFLSKVSKIYHSAFFRKSFLFRYHPEKFTLQERVLLEIQYQIEYYYCLFQFLEVVKTNVDKSIEEEDFVFEEKESFERQDFYNEKDRYFFDGQNLCIYDEEMGVNRKEKYFPKSLEDKSKGHRAGIFYFAEMQGKKPLGQCKVFYSTGEVKGQFYYKEGKLHGPSTCYTKEGKILAQGWYLEGKKVGKNLQYYSSGRLCSKKRFKEGKLHGMQEYFFESGEKQAVIDYKNGVLDGATKLFFSSGQKKREIHYKKGLLNGIEKMWNEKGQQIVEAEFFEDRPIGVSRSWYSNGQMKQEVKFFDKPHHFDLTRWDEKGKILKKKVFVPKSITKEVIEDQEQIHKNILHLKNKLKGLLNP